MLKGILHNIWYHGGFQSLWRCPKPWLMFLFLIVVMKSTRKQNTWSFAHYLRKMVPWAGQTEGLFNIQIIQILYKA